jgi:hypothetical protein
MVEVGSSDGRSSFTVLAALFTSVKGFTVEALKVFFYMDDFFYLHKRTFLFANPVRTSGVNVTTMLSTSMTLRRISWSVCH